MIENNPKPSHLAYAAAHAIQMHSEDSDQGEPARVVYKIDREHFQNGVAKATRLGESSLKRSLFGPESGLRDGLRTSPSSS
ncbi:MAG: hypothetical protein AABZ55_04960 [Bdellovibrionota bacterium]